MALLQCIRSNLIPALIGLKGSLIILSAVFIGSAFGHQEDSECFCGRNGISERIVNGEKSLKGSHPWQASLEINLNDKWITYCGGVLISEKYVLTAAHCKKSSITSLLMVRAKFAVTSSEERGIIRGITSFIRNPAYGAQKNFDDDIAVLTLNDTIQFSDLVHPVCLPTYLRNESFADKFAVVSGFGTLSENLSTPSVTLQEVDVKILPPGECLDQEREDLTGNMMCAYADGKDACQGDSGGPLVYTDENGVSLLVGLVSFGYGCARQNYPGIYTRITTQMDWIQNQTGMDFCYPNLWPNKNEAALLSTNTSGERSLLENIWSGLLNLV